MRHAAMLALPTVGLPSMMAGLSWTDEIVDEAKKKRKRR
jgi:hypothetical protein